MGRRLDVIYLSDGGALPRQACTSLRRCLDSRRCGDVYAPFKDALWSTQIYTSNGNSRCALDGALGGFDAACPEKGRFENWVAKIESTVVHHRFSDITGANVGCLRGYSRTVQMSKSPVVQPISTFSKKVGQFPAIMNWKLRGWSLLLRNPGDNKLLDFKAGILVGHSPSMFAAIVGMKL